MTATATTEVPDEQVETLVAASRALIGIAVLSLSELGDRVALVPFRALVILDDAGSLNAGQLSERLGVSASSVTRLCDRLVSDGLVRRVANPHSRREVLVTISDRGRTMVKKVMNRRHKDMRRILAELNARERSQLIAALEVFTAHAGTIHGEQLLAEWPVS